MLLDLYKHSLTRCKGLVFGGFSIYDFIIEKFVAKLLGLAQYSVKYSVFMSVIWHNCVLYFSSSYFIVDSALALIYAAVIANVIKCYDNVTNM